MNIRRLIDRFVVCIPLGNVQTSTGTNFEGDWTSVESKSIWWIDLQYERFSSIFLCKLIDYLGIDFKYFEDPTDHVRDPMGTLFPLWKFPPSVTNRSVTALIWNSTYSDMLIIGYGLCEFFDGKEDMGSFSSILKIIQLNVCKVELLSSHWIIVIQIH